MNRPVTRYPLPQQHEGAHGATHSRWLDVLVLRCNDTFGRFVTEACCDERLLEKLAARAGVSIANMSRMRNADQIEIGATIEGDPARIIIVREFSKAPIKALREFWRRSTERTSTRPFRLTGRTGITQVKGRTVRGPSTYVDKRVVDLLLSANQLLYATINAARSVDAVLDDERTAVNEMVLAMAVLTASEADALATLVQYDQIPVSRIHARAIGEHSEHISAFINDFSLAKQAYEATNASRQHLLGKLPVPDAVRAEIVNRIDASHEPRTMEKIMRAAEREQEQDASVWMTAGERSWLSKWNHGDAVALQEIADRLALVDDDLWAAINAINEGDGLMLRATVHMLRVLYALCGLFGVQQTPVDELSQKHAALAAEFHARVPEHMRSTAVTSGPADHNHKENR